MAPEQARRLYRFQISSKPGRSEKFVIKEEQAVRAELVLTNLDGK